MATCARPKCSGTITWVRTVNDRPMPLDVEPVPDGNVVLERGGFARVLRKGETVEDGRLRYVAHWVTCADPPPRMPKR